jgi:hypothetical protein
MNATQQNQNGREPFGRLDRRLVGIGLASIALALTGCSLFRPYHSPPKAVVASLQQSTNAPAAISVTMLQFQVMRFADGYVAQIAQAADDFSARVGTPQARLAAVKWKLGQATSAFTAATGPSPVVNALDMLVLVTLSRMVMEDYGVETFGEAVLPVLEVQRRQETNAWTIANSVLRPAQRQEMMDLIKAWRLAKDRKSVV